MKTDYSDYSNSSFEYDNIAVNFDGQQNHLASQMLTSHKIFSEIITFAHLAI